MVYRDRIATTSFSRAEDASSSRREKERIVKVHRDHDGRREIWFRNKNRILEITRIGEAIWSPYGAKWAVGGCRGGGTGGREEHIDMGKRYGNGIQRSALSLASQLPSVVRLPPSTCSPSRSSGYTREEIALLITRRNVLFQTLCNIANRGILRLLRTDWRRKIAAACRDSRHLARFGSFEGVRRENFLFRFRICIIYMYIVFIQSLSRRVVKKRKLSKIKNNLLINILLHSIYLYSIFFLFGINFKNLLILYNF